MKGAVCLLFAIEEHVITKNNVHFHFIPTKKFKTIHFVLKCKAPLERETITKRALLPFVLQKGTENYRTEKELMTRLDELYGATLSIDGAKKGNYHIISFRLEIANDQYLPNQSNLLNDALALYKEIIFHPRIENDQFQASVVEREKLTLQNKINSIYDDKLSYANVRLIEEMCENERFRIHKDGYVEDLPTINGENLYEYYKELLQTDRLDLYVVGDFEQKAMEEVLMQSIRRDTARTSDETIEENVENKEMKEVEETQPIQQAKLHIGYRTNCTYKDADYFALQVFNGIFGGFPSSKLFANVREKHSLAYYAASRIESHKGLLLVYSGIEPTDYKKAREIIELQMKAMKNGDFTREQVEETKELIISELKEMLDNIYGIPELLYQQVVGQKTISPKTFMEEIKRVTKEDVVQLAQKITADTVFLLTSDGGEQHEAKDV